MIADELRTISELLNIIDSNEIKTTFYSFHVIYYLCNNNNGTILY